MLLPVAFVAVFSLTQFPVNTQPPELKIQAEKFISLSKSAELSTLKVRKEVRQQTINFKLNDSDRERINKEVESKLHELLTQSSCKFFTVNQFQEFNLFLEKSSGKKFIESKWNTAVADFLKYLGKPANAMELPNITFNQAEFDDIKKIDASDSGSAFGKFESEEINVSEKSEIYALIIKLCKQSGKSIASPTTR